MADTIKIGNLDISAFKVGSSDCKIYLGDTLLYPTTPPSFQGKWKATYSNGTTTTAECGGSSSITQNEINLTNLVSIVIGNCVTSIGNQAFYACRGLTSIDIPSGVTNIDNYAFYRCSGLTSITVNAITPPTLGSYALLYTNNCPIYVPYGSVDTYKAASGWRTYADRIQAIPTLPQWVTFSNGDTIPSDLQIYGIKGIVNDLSKVFYVDYENIYVQDAGSNKFTVFIGEDNCYSEYDILSNTSVEYTFSNIGCSDSYTVSSKTISNISNDIQLYIYA
jgi:hypothetical protein